MKKNFYQHFYKNIVNIKSKILLKSKTTINELKIYSITCLQVGVTKTFRFYYQNKRLKFVQISFIGDVRK